MNYVHLMTLNNISRNIHRLSVHRSFYYNLNGSYSVLFISHIYYSNMNEYSLHVNFLYNFLWFRKNAQFIRFTIHNTISKFMITGENDISY